MALHTELPIHKAAHDLLGVVASLVRNMPRDVKPIVGRQLYSDCLAMSTAIARANQAQDKGPYLAALLDRVQCAEVQLRMSRDARFIATSGYARAIELTQTIGRQASGWRKHAASPAAGASRRPGPSER
jgi:hypothetical protein